MKNKRFICFAIVAIMMFSVFSPLAHASNANSSDTYEVTVSVATDAEVKVIVPAKYQNVEGMDERIRDFVNRHDFSDGDTITIYNIVDFEDGSINVPVMSSVLDGNIEPQAFSYQYETTIVSKSAERVLETIHIMSVAKGLTKTFGIKTTFTKGYKFVSGDIPFVTATAEFEKSVEYTATFEFTGPPNDSSNNSRNYYIDFYGATAYWTQDKYTGTGTFVSTRSGYGEICTGYFEYSHDMYIA